MIFKRKSFKKARPIWSMGERYALNCTVMLEARVKNSACDLLRIAGNGLYSVFINGGFVFTGPARAGRGYYRVDELDIGSYINKEENIITVLVASYNCDTYCTVNEPGFICAELEKNGEVTAFTYGEGFKLYEYSEKVRKVTRYSFQRTFTEVYRFDQASLGALSSDGRRELDTELCPEAAFIEREVSYPEFEREAALSVIESGSVTVRPAEKHFDHYAITDAGDKLSGFKLGELEVNPTYLAEDLDLTPASKEKTSFPITLNNSYATAEMRCNITGLIRVRVSCKSDTKLFLLFDEILSDEKIDFTRLDCSNVVLYYLKGGESYELITQEPYVFKYINAVSLGGELEIEELGVIRLAFNASEIKKSLNTEKADDEIKRIYSAAIETFRQNAFDIYMDCPSRERSGWLCDSFFTARVEHLLTGKSSVEKSFLSNFVMEDKVEWLPKGMLPMCYPADHVNGVFIPNWAMWFVIELKEYLARTSDREFIDELRPRIYELLDYFKGFELENGLLGRLKSWIFIEWSRSNDLVHDISYPSNMLYSLFKRTVADLYSDDGLKKEADDLTELIREKSRMGLFFCDNSVFDENKVPTLSGECTESCQYYAFFTGVATPERDTELWETLVRDFGPARKGSGRWEDIYPSNAFIGNYLRCELLRRNGLFTELERDIRGYFDYMARRTGTLWEHDSTTASCNHGFSSHVIVWLNDLGYLI